MFAAFVTLLPKLDLLVVRLGKWDNLLHINEGASTVFVRLRSHTLDIDAVIEEPKHRRR
jgi:hypothetical protein